MKKILLVIVILLFSLPVFAGEIYTWTDKSGVENITTTPPPESAKIKNRSTFKRDHPQAIESFQRKQRAATERGFAGWQNSQKRDFSKQRAERDAQASRDQRADQVKRETAARLQAVRDSGLRLPQANVDIVEKAAEIKAEQIRTGTDRPITAQEDTDFHMRQMQYEIDTLKSSIKP